jgi:hypothetical protein
MNDVCSDKFEFPEDFDPGAEWICVSCGGKLDLSYEGMTSLWPHRAKCLSCGKKSQRCSDPWMAVSQIGKQIG